MSTRPSQRISRRCRGARPLNFSASGSRPRSYTRHRGRSAKPIRRRLGARLRRTHEVIAGNLRELDKLIEGPEQDWHLALNLVSNTGSHDAEQEAYFNEFDRLLHNVVAAIGTLIDHTRVVARRYEGTPFYDEYTRRVQQVGALPAARFVKDLRNYMLHRSLPAPYNQVTLTQQKVTYQLHAEGNQQTPPSPETAR